jgi:thiamine pyrophosphate-dependent acetolactate synthase large subunit-like protein
MDARKEGASIIAIAGDVETKLIDTEALEELNPYRFFEAASLYTGRLVNPEQARAIINTAILTAVMEKGPTVISIPGDVASAEVAAHTLETCFSCSPVFRPSDEDLDKLVQMINDAKTVTIFGGDGCRDARDEVVQLAAKLKAPVGYSFRGRLFGSFSWASMANAAPNAFGAQLAYPGRQTIALCGDGGFTMLALGDLLTQVERKTPVLQIILNNVPLDFVNIEMPEAGMIPFGVEFENPNFAKVAEAMGARGIRIEELAEP